MDVFLQPLKRPFEIFDFSLGQQRQRHFDKCFEHSNRHMPVDRNFYGQSIVRFIDIDHGIILVLLKNEAVLFQLNPPARGTLAFESWDTIFSSDLIERPERF